jgi:hypothetical protein
MRKLVLAHLLRERGEDGYEGDEGEDEEGEGGGDERQIVRLLVGGRMLRRRRLRKLVLAHLLRERGEEGYEGDEGEDEEGEGGGDERQIVRLLVGGRMLRRRKLRRLALAHILRERAA